MGAKVLENIQRKKLRDRARTATLELNLQTSNFILFSNSSMTNTPMYWTCDILSKQDFMRWRAVRT